MLIGINSVNSVIASLGLGILSSLVEKFYLIKGKVHEVEYTPDIPPNIVQCIE